MDEWRKLGRGSDTERKVSSSHGSGTKDHDGWLERSAPGRFKSLSRWFFSSLPLLLLFGLALSRGWQIEYRSTAEGVFTEEQARRGERVQRRICLRCHIKDYYTGGLLESWEGNTVGALSSLIMNTMPEDRPSSLKIEQYTDMMAYILQINGFPTGENELPADKTALSRIIIERKKK